MRFGSNAGRRYGFAILSIMLALLARALMIPILGDQRFSLSPFLAAVVFCAWYSGIGPSILASALSMVLVWCFFFVPQFSFHLEHPVAQIGELVFFALLSGMVIALGEANRRAHTNLEELVRERSSELSAANDNLRSLTGRLLELRDEERRSLSRELHDSVGQLLAAISMNDSALKKMPLPPAAVVAITDNDELVQEASRQIRTLSHLLHPPLLDELGLVSALKVYVEGFSKRSGIAVALHAPDDLCRLTDQVELAAFRVVQECLTNIHRHSGSRDGSIEVTRTSGTLQVSVRDSGRGIAGRNLNGAGGQPGVGLRGMTERVRQLGGALRLDSGERGTTVTANLPIAAAEKNAATPKVDSLHPPLSAEP
jgi:signal transduction histidine kinase